MAVIIPITAAGARRIQVLLGSKLVTVRTYYGVLAPIWRMDLYDDQGAALIRGVALVPGINLLSAESELTRIYGEFWYVPSRGQGDEPDAPGNTAELWWFETGEIVRPVEDASTDPLSFDAAAMFTEA